MKAVMMEERLAAFKTHWWSEREKGKDEAPGVRVMFHHEGIAPGVVEGYGLGMVAERDLAAGTVLLVEDGRTQSGLDATEAPVWAQLKVEQKAYACLDSGVATPTSTSSTGHERGEGKEGEEEELRWVRVNCFGVPPGLSQTGENEVALYGAMSMFNHSCAPNVVLHFVESHAAPAASSSSSPSLSSSSSSSSSVSDEFGSLLAVAYVIEEVKKGDQLFISYMVADTSVVTRRKHFQAMWGFVCRCDRCAGRLPDRHALAVADAEMVRTGDEASNAARGNLQKLYSALNPSVEGFDLKMLSSAAGLRQYEAGLLGWMEAADAAAYSMFHEQRNELFKFLLMAYDFMDSAPQKYRCVMHRLVFESAVMPRLHPKKLETYSALNELMATLKQTGQIQGVMAKHYDMNQLVDWAAFKEIKKMIAAAEQTAHQVK
jgi:hypothetical protein